MKEYGIDVRGRLAKVRVSNPLLAVCEAAMNSIHAIEELNSKDNDHFIKINFIRSSQQSLMESSIEEEIVGLSIIDSGIGFNDSNFSSFLTFDSTYKQNLGGKGVGRLTWLKFFESISIESSYFDSDSGNNYKRSFDFSERGVEEKLVSDAQNKENTTTIKMNGLRNGKFPKSLETIAQHFIEHFLSYFATDSIPKLIISDEESEINLNEKFQKEFGEDIYDINFKIGDESFKLTSLKVKNINSGHKIYVCAHKRTVSKATIDLKKEYPLFKNKLKDSDGNDFFYIGFLESNYLDSHVNDNRTGFEFGDDSETADLISKIKFSEIKGTAISAIKGDLREELQFTKGENVNRVKNYINKAKPQFKYLLKHKTDEIAEISGEDDKQIYSDLRKVMYDFETESELAAEELIKSIESDETNEELLQKQNELYEKIEDRKKISLAQYICDRRVILDILKKKLSKNSSDSYELEKVIHKLIFPLNSTSDDLNYDDQNLWVLDEKLCYHNYLASDMPLKKIEALESNDKSRPDLIIFDGPIAISDSINSNDSVVIVEFKRPGRNDYSSSDNPIDQTLNYIFKILEGSSTDRNGRVITTPENIRFYCYIVCDITPTLQPIIKKYDATRSSDGKGYYFYNKGANAYVEILPYDKVLSDALKRNQFLFEKLGLPIV